MVARDGIEPPTPAFSGLRSTAELPGRIVGHVFAKTHQQTLNSNKPVCYRRAAAFSSSRYSDKLFAGSPGTLASSSHFRSATASW